MRRVSLTARTASDAETSDEIEIVLLTFEHPALAAPIRISSDPTERLSIEPLYYGTRSSWSGADPETDPYLFAITSVDVPSDMEDTPTAATLVLEDVDNEIAQTMFTFTDRPTVHMAVVLASSPDLVEAEYRNMRVVGVNVDGSDVSISISRQPIEDESVPMDRFTRDRFPGLFR